MIRENTGKNPKPVAVFDWDNTVIKGDIGDGTLFWMLAHDLIRKPRSWASTSKALTPDAAQALNQACPLKTLADPLPTSQNPACTDAILSIYDGTLPGSKTPAWSDKINKDTIEPAYAWAVQLTQGHKPDEIRKLAGEAIRFNLENPLGAKQKLGTQERAASIRIYDQIADLIRALQKNGFDVWIASASSQYVVEPFASRVGVDPSHVIGVRSALDKTGRVTSGFESCGPYPKGNQDIISYRQGKRCWINQVIGKVKDPRKMMETPSPIAFAAGDSDTDAFFVKDASRLKLVINRGKRELMCRAYAGLGGRDGGAVWLVNPMFIEPKPKLAEGYRCKDFGLPDQEDTVSSF
jgi:phosphoserine phosphatase